jgi:hypothetical protein
MNFVVYCDIFASNLLLETCFTLISGIFQKIPIFWFLTFSTSGATGLERELGQWEELDNFHTNKSS